MPLNAPYTPNTVIQSTQVSNDLVGLANGTNDTTNNSMSTYRGEVVFDHVTSGCVWSGDSYGVSRNASQTSGVVYISGVRLTVSAVSARLFTASKDTYIDVNGSGVQVYTEVTNNAASPALTAGNIRIGIIITGASTIAAATSVNQGQETMILPIASSIAYAVTDSLGNLICCRDPNHRIIGQRIIVSAPSGITSASAVQVTGVSVPIIAPNTTRKIRISAFVANVFPSVAATINFSIWDGVVGSGTQIQQCQMNATSSTNGGFIRTDVTLTPGATSKTYNLGWSTSAGTTNLQCDATRPAFILVELL